MNISSRLAILMTLLALSTAAVVGVLVYRSVVSASLPADLGRVETDARSAAATLGEYADAARDDVLAASHAPTVVELVNATVAGGVDPKTGLAQAAVRGYVTELLTAIVTNKPRYHKLRVIGVVDGGREVVRVDRMGPGGDVRVVPEGELQRKGDRPFFVATLALRPGEVYVSDVDLNQENGEIAAPYVPTLRIATPLVARDGAVYGILVANVDMRIGFDRLLRHRRDGVSLYVTNDRGDYLLHPDEGRAFGFDLGFTSNVGDDAPEIAAMLGSDGPSAREVGSKEGRLLAAAASVRLAGGPRLVVVETTTRDASVPFGRILGTSLVAALLAAVAAGLIAWSVARPIVRPIVRITTAIDAFTHGKSVDLPVADESEIGRLSRAFERMRDEVRAKTLALTAEVEERRRAESSRDASETRARLYGAAIDSTDDAVLTKTLDGVITGWNHGAARLYGYDELEAVGAPVDILVPDDRDGEIRGILDRVRRGESVEHYETVRRTKAGERVPVSLTVLPVRSSSGEIVGASTIAHDLRPLQDAEERFRLSVEASPNGMVLVDGSGTITMVNAATERMFGYSRGELLGSGVEILVPTWARDRHPAYREEFAEAPTVRAMAAHRALHGVRKDGTEFPVEVGLNPLAVHGGALVLATVVDVTERKRAELAEAQSRRQFRALAEGLPLLAWTCAPDGTCDYLSPQWVDYTGVPEEEQLRAGWLGQIHPDDADRLTEAWSRTVAEGTQFDIEFRIRRRDGVFRWFKTRAVPIQGPDGAIVRWFGANMDVEDIKQAEEALARQADELRASNAELEQFAYVASHDLQEPLRMVASYTELLGSRYRGRLDEKADKYIGYAVEGARRMQRLVGDLLKFSRAGSQHGEREPVDTREVVGSVLGSMRHTIAETGAEFDLGELPTVCAVPGQLDHVFLNLVSNAIKFRHDGEPPRVRVGAAREPDAWRFSVRDNGIGIDKEYAERIFQMFQRLHERGRYEGSGIGLAITKKIVERHGGRVWFESEPGRGSEFFFTIPSGQAADDDGGTER